jgi:hypothetical protein
MSGTIDGEGGREGGREGGVDTPCSMAVSCSSCSSFPINRSPIPVGGPRSSNTDPLSVFPIFPSSLNPLFLLTFSVDVSPRVHETSKLKS